VRLFGVVGPSYVLLNTGGIMSTNNNHQTGGATSQSEHMNRAARRSGSKVAKRVVKPSKLLSGLMFRYQEQLDLDDLFRLEQPAFEAFESLEAFKVEEFTDF